MASSSAASAADAEIPTTKTLDTIIRYYHTRESKLGYKYVLGDTRHFAYYPASNWWLFLPVPLAPHMRRMERYLGSMLALPRGAQVLDLGCGAGHVARTIAASLGYRVRALDLTPYHVQLATQHIAQAEKKGDVPPGAVTVERGNYHDLGVIKSNSVDGAYTMETLVHSEDLPKAVSEIFRVIKPGGRVAHNEYEFTFPNIRFGRQMMEDILDGSGMARERPPGIWKKTFEEAGFENVKVDDITVHVRPFAVLFFVLGFIPGLIFVALGMTKRFPNTMCGLLIPFLYVGNHIKYVTITAKKPGVLVVEKDR